MSELKDMLVYYRNLRGYSQRELADLIGVSASTIGMYESGKRFPTHETEEALADIFNVSLNNLRGIDDEKKSNYPVYDSTIQELATLLPRLTPEQKSHIVMTARLFAQQNDN